jgi:hypothetical protein
MPHPFAGLKGINQPGAALQGSGDQACPCGESDRDCGPLAWMTTASICLVSVGMFRSFRCLSA